NHRRFAFFSIAALTAAQLTGFIPDILHLNDWQTGLAAVALKGGYAKTELSNTKALFTIHNLPYHTFFPMSAPTQLRLSATLLTTEWIYFLRAVRLLKAGLIFSDGLPTVSPTYAREIQTPELGCGLDGLLRTHRARLVGILNGIDDQQWNPETDPALPARY